MKKKGFTLIELLAVIVILAIIALIATPTILGVIQKSKKASSEASAYGYIDAVEKYIMTNSMDMSKPNINNGIYKDSELDVEYKGKGPDNALITVEKGIVKEAKLCINKYSFDYDGKEVTNSVNNYCSDNYKVKLVIDDNIEEKSIEKELSTTFEASDITNKTNIVCNNGAVPTIENNILTISNIFGDTTCKINNTLEETINNIDNTENNIIMISDEETTNTLTIKENKNVILDLNGKIIDKPTTGSVFNNYGILKIYGNDISKIINSNANCGHGIITLGGYTILNGGIYETTGTCATIYSNFNGSKNGTVDVINSKVLSNSSGIIIYSKHKNPLNVYNSSIISNNNSIHIVDSEVIGIINIYGGIIISKSNSAVYNINATINITQTFTPIYISSLAQAWHPAILNNGTGSINIEADQADNCTNNIEDTTSGLCVYAEGDKDFTHNTSNAALQNARNGKVYIDGGTYFGGNQGLNNGYTDSILNINNAVVKSGRHAVLNNSTGTINICKSILNGNIKDFYNNSTGTINYSSDVIFTDGTNTPNIYNQSGTINANYTGTCSY